MWELNVNNTWPFQFSKLGGYWDAKNEIDIAALDPEGKNMILGECKYWKEPVGLNVLHALEAKACDVAWERDRRKVWYVLFSISGFSDELCAHAATRDDLLLIDDRGRQLIDQPVQYLQCAPKFFEGIKEVLTNVHKTDVEISTSVFFLSVAVMRIKVV